MKTGHVDDGWAREHHDLWYDDVNSGRAPARRIPQDVSRRMAFVE